MADRYKEPPPLWRDAAGVFTAFIVVASFVAIGFIEMIAEIAFGIVINIDAGWMAAMLSLASAAFGFLIGKRSGTRILGFDRPLCSTCPIRDQIKASDGRT